LALRLRCFADVIEKNFFGVGVIDNSPRGPLRSAANFELVIFGKSFAGAVGLYVLPNIGMVI
jgi:hypothetical protein